MTSMPQRTPSPDANRSAVCADRVKWASIALAIAAMLVGIRGLPVAQGFQMAVSWVEGLGPLAPIAFAGMYFLATILLLPAWPLSVAAGALFGLFMGSAVVIAGATTGAAGAFVLARYLARHAVEQRLRAYPRFAAVDHAVGEGGWRIVLLLRLSPAFPFTLQNYLYGLTAIRFWPCVMATAVGIVPGVFMYVYFGVAGRAGLEAAGGQVDGGWAQGALLVVGLVATILVTVYVTRLATRAIARRDEFAPPSKPVAEWSRPAPSNPWIPAVGFAAVALLLVVFAACVHNPPAFLVRMLTPAAAATGADPAAMIANHASKKDISP